MSDWIEIEFDSFDSSGALGLQYASNILSILSSYPSTPDSQLADFSAGFP